jgi:hypothetical protein
MSSKKYFFTLRRNEMLVIPNFNWGHRRPLPLTLPLQWKGGWGVRLPLNSHINVGAIYPDKMSELLRRSILHTISYHLFSPKNYNFLDLELTII